MKRTFLFLVLVGTFAFPAFAQSDAEDYAARFDSVWRLVDERYWNLAEGGVDWEGLRPDFEARALAAEDDESFYSVLEEMYEELADDHSVFVPPARVEEIRSQYGDLPCLGVFAQRGEMEEERGRVSSRLIDDRIGYIRVPDLVGTAADLRGAVRSLDGRADALVLDLRGNPGGRLVEMMQAAGIFTNGFLWRTVTRWTLPLPYPAIGATETELPLIVLIDSEVNSAAEGLAGALQASGRAVVIGERSAGNVEAVMPFCFRDGSQAWIATGVLAPIGAPTWEGRGVVPNVESSAKGALDAALEYLTNREGEGTED